MTMKRAAFRVGCLALLAVTGGCTRPAPLLVTSQLDKTVREYNGTTGSFVKVAASGGALGDPLGVVVGPDGNLLVSDGQTNEVKRYDRTTGAFIGVFASTHLSAPAGMTLYQGALYVANSQPPEGVQRFDATTGVNTGSFVPTITNPIPRDVKVNPANKRLYVLYYNAATVETFDLATVASHGLLMPAGTPIGSGGLYTPTAMAFGPDGNSTSPAEQLEGISAYDATARPRERSSTFSPKPAAISTPRPGSHSAPIRTSTSPLRTRQT